MSKPKTLTHEQESAIALAAKKLERLAAVQDMLQVNTFRAAQRTILRELVMQVQVQFIVNKANAATTVKFSELPAQPG